ncbi:MAG: helix-turn-helix domain-containing protein [Streptosporangiaceae bacterium]
MTDGGFSQVVRAWQARRGMSLRALATAAPYDAGALSRILNGRKPVTAHVAAVLDDALDAAGEIVAAAEAEMASRLPRDMELTRRHLEDTISAGAMSAAELDDWQQAMMRYGYRTRDVPSPVLLDDLTGDLADLEAAITRHRSASALRRLAGVAAGMSGMMVLTLIKTGDRRAWRGWSRTAEHAALEAGDAKVLAWARAQESYGWFYAGEMTTAIDTARAAQTVPCVGAALAAALEMRAHAARGDGGNARAALTEAERFLDALPETDRTASAFGYGESQLRFHAGSAFTLLRDLPAALEATARALELCAPGDYTDWALSRLDRAQCFAWADPDTGLGYAAETITALTGPQRQGIIADRARRLLGALSPAQLTSPLAREFADLVQA